MSGLSPPKVLSYEGQVAVPFIYRPFPPTSSNFQFDVPTIWIDTAAEIPYILVGKPQNVANWLAFGGGGVLTETLTGNSGGAVSPLANNINVVGDTSTINIVGNPGTHTLTASTTGSVATTYTCDTGSATPAANNLNVFGGTGATTVGSGSTITINATGFAVAYTDVTNAMSPYTVLAGDEYISVNCTAGPVTLLFPNAPVSTRLWTVKDRTGNANTNNITITTPGGTVTFDGGTSYVINTNYESINLLANATPAYEIF